MDSLLRWTGVLEWTHVLLVGFTCSEASLRERVWDMAEVPESIPLSPLLPLGNETCSDVDSSPPQSPSVVLPLSFSLFPSSCFYLFFFYLFSSIELFLLYIVEHSCKMLDYSISNQCISTLMLIRLSKLKLIRFVEICEKTY